MTTLLKLNMQAHVLKKWQPLLLSRIVQLYLPHHLRAGRPLLIDRIQQQLESRAQRTLGRAVHERLERRGLL